MRHARVEAVPRPVHLREMGAQGAQRESGLDHRVLRAVQRTRDVAPHGRVAGAHLVGLQEGDAARRGVGSLGELLHHGAGGGIAGDGQRGHRAEPDAGHLGAELLPTAPGAASHVELRARASAADPDQAEVPDRRTRRAPPPPRGGRRRTLPRRVRARARYRGCRHRRPRPGRARCCSRHEGWRRGPGRCHRPLAARADSRMASAASQGRG